MFRCHSDCKRSLQQATSAVAVVCFAGILIWEKFDLEALDMEVHLSVECEQHPSGLFNLIWTAEMTGLKC